MKITVKRDAPAYKVFTAIFGYAPIEAEPAGELDGKQRVRVIVAKLTGPQRIRWADHLRKVLNVGPLDAVHKAPTLDLDDVDVELELFT